VRNMEQAEVAKYWEANAENWTRFSRAGYDVYRDALNTPAFLAMLPPVSGLTGLDIGCGEGANTRQLARLGARMHAIDVSPTFIRHAQAEEDRGPLGIAYQAADGTALPFAEACFDFAAAFMSLMDMPDHCRAVEEAARVLRPGGFLQFSILHPCFAPPHRRVLRDADGRTLAIEVARYFDGSEGYLDEWMFSSLPAEERARVEPFRIPVFHRTLSSWVELICRAGLVIEQFGEPSATPELAAAVPMVADTRVAPLFLHVRVRKPAGSA
jgi:ubiquinone/menaquinone biosynthesis C-methylase UbiE